MTSSSRNETIRADLTERILKGELRPGNRLDEQGIADHYKVSRTPVREVLQQLAAAGLAEIKPRRGAFVKLLTRQEILDLFEAMAELEAICAKHAAGRMSLIEISHLEDLLREGASLAKTADGGAYANLNLKFHQAIFEGAHNASLMEMAQILRLRTSPYRNAQFSRNRGNEAQRMASSQQEHEALLEAIQARDGAKAYQLMSHHITSSSVNIARMVEELGGEA